MPTGSITGTGLISASPTGYSTSAQLTQAVQTIWSKEILFQAMPILRFEQFAVKKTELGVQPGLTINFMRYNNLSAASQLTEGIRISTDSLSASQYQISVAEQGKGVAVSELLLNASFDDVMASSSRLLGRNMATYLDTSARDAIISGVTNTVYGYLSATGAVSPQSPYDAGTVSTTRAGLTGSYYLSVNAMKDAVETLATLNIPRLGETYVAFVAPHQSRRLRDNPEWIEVTKYASPGNFMLGEIGRLNDVVYIETTQVKQIQNSNSPSNTVYQGILLGDNVFGHAIALPVELRDGGVIDFGREHQLAWYAIWGYGTITANAGCLLETN